MQGGGNKGDRIPSLEEISAGCVWGVLVQSVMGASDGAEMLHGCGFLGRGHYSGQCAHGVHRGGKASA
jgi:hypothetical protein